MESPEFFAVEAGEYLDRLRLLASNAEPSAMEQFALLCRSLRGSSMMANQEAIGRAAAALEHLALAAKLGRLPWNHQIRGLARRTVDDIARLVAKLGTWSTAESAMTEAIVAELDAVTGQPSLPSEPSRHGHDVGFIAFVAGQGSALAGALEATARAMEERASAAEPLQDARRLVRSLNGLASLRDVPPMAELLEGIEQVIGVDSDATVPPAAGSVLRAAGVALAKATGDLAGNGSADPETTEVRTFTSTLKSYLAAEADIVPIESLLYDDEPEPTDEPASMAPMHDDLADLELISMGERLQLAADELEQARSDTQRALRAQALTQSLHGFSGVTHGPMQIALSDFADAGRDAIAKGTGAGVELAGEHEDALVRLLREAGSTLCSNASDEQRAIRLFDIAAELRTLAATPRDSPELNAPETAEPVHVDEMLADLAASWASYEQYRDDALAAAAPEHGLADASTGPPALAAPEEATSDTADEILPIGELCYGGQDAVDRAMSLRHEILSTLADPRGDRSRLAELVEEVFDLVQLGLDDKP